MKTFLQNILIKNKYWTVSTLAGMAFMFCLDLFIKEKVEKDDTADLENKLKAIQKDKEIAYLTKYKNYGAFRNLGDKHPGVVKIISAVVCVVCFLVYIISLGKVGKKGLTLGLTVLLGGALNNTYDRIKRGYVVDYLRFKTPVRFINNLVFNISDFFIFVGALISGLNS